MNEGEAQKQIANMVRFIEQEAREKAEEIREAADHELEAWKSEKLYNKRLELKRDFEAERKNREVQGKIAESKLKNSQQERIMRKRQDILDKLKQDSAAQLVRAVKGNKQKYTALLEDLLVEGLLRLIEEKVTVRCVKEDTNTVKGLLNKARKRFLEEMQRVANQNKAEFKMTVNISMSPDPLPSSCIGGVWVQSPAYTSRPDAIIVRNSLDARLNTVMEDMTPTIRALLFPENEQRAKEIADSRAEALRRMAEGEED